MQLLRLDYMKKLLIIFLCAVFLLCGCANEDTTVAADNEKLNIIATIFPAYDFAREIGGEQINLKMLIPPGSESHTYEPSPQDIIDIENCDIFIYAGGNGDKWVETIIEAVDTDTAFISLMEIVTPLEETHHEDGHSTHHHDEDDTEEYDEHVWTSPLNADIICNKICQVICSADTDNEEYYTNNYISYSQKLAKLDDTARSIVNNAKRNKIIFADRFPIRYFTEEYGIEYQGAFPGCATETEPSPKTLISLIDIVRTGKIPVVFYRELSDKKVAQIVCEDTDARMLQFHSCHSITKDEYSAGVTYIQLMEQNLANLKEALN